MRAVLLLLAGCVSYAQTLVIGAKGGGRVTDDLTESIASTTESKRYIVGPMIQLGLPLGFGVEIDALYSREGYRYSWSYSASRERANVWQFPVLLQYKLPLRALKPFIEAGYAARVIHGFDDYYAASYLGGGQFSTYYTHSHESTNYGTSQGFVAGAGVGFAVGHLRLSPEFRYTHWNNRPIAVFIPDGPSFTSTQNQIDLLFGIGWDVH